MLRDSDQRPPADPHPDGAVAGIGVALRDVRWRRAQRALTFLANNFAPALILLTPFVAFLVYHRYEVWRTEVFLSVSYLLLGGFGISAVISLHPQLLRPAIFGVMLIVFADLHFRLSEIQWILAFQSWEYASEYGPTAIVAGASVLLIGAMVFTWVLREHLGIIFATAFCAMLLSLSVLPMDRIAVGEIEHTNPELRVDLPPIVHLVFDAQIGLAGLPDNVPESQALKQDLKDFYRHYGFTVFSRAYSPYGSTTESLSNLLNGRAASSMGAFVVESKDTSLQIHRTLTKNSWFHHLSNLGYVVRIYQTDYLDFCNLDAVPMNYCYVVPSNSIHSLKEAPLPAVVKTKVILGAFLSGALLPRIMAKLLSPAQDSSGILSGPLEWFSEQPQLGAISAANVMKKIAEDPATVRRGTATFAHVLIPHGAYILDAACRPRPKVDDWLGPWATKPPATTNSPASRRLRYRLYFDQVRCAHLRLSAILEKLIAADALADATVIVHGDHGSRIALRMPNYDARHGYSDRDLIDAHSTLFAVKSPKLSAGENVRRETIQELFSTMLLGRPSRDKPSGVYLSSSPLRRGDQAYVEVPMPEF